MSGCNHGVGSILSCAVLHRRRCRHGQPQTRGPLLDFSFGATPGERPAAGLLLPPDVIDYRRRPLNGMLVRALSESVKTETSAAGAVKRCTQGPLLCSKLGSGNATRLEHRLQMDSVS
jgi:hypothetical protein